MLSMRSVVILLILLAILLFLVGFRLGKYIERIDKTYVPPPTPTQSFQPTPTNIPLTLATYKHKDCGVVFLHPQNLKESKSSSTEAELKNDSERIFLSCDSKQIAKFKDDLKKAAASEEARIRNQSVTVLTNKTENSWVISNTLTGKPVFFTVTKNLNSLVSKTLEFTK